jgi:hypothetical protein
VALDKKFLVPKCTKTLAEGRYLKAHASLDLLVKHFCHNAVKVLQHLNRNLWLYLAIANELVECICHGGTDADIVSYQPSRQHTNQRWIIPATPVQLVEVLLLVGHLGTFLDKRQAPAEEELMPVYLQLRLLVPNTLKGRESEGRTPQSGCLAYHCAECTSYPEDTR